MASAAPRGMTARVRSRDTVPRHLQADSCRAARKRACAEERAARIGAERVDSTAAFAAWSPNARRAKASKSEPIPRNATKVSKLHPR
eukprot:2724621-Alexandrium_andersonii.AAC.1